MSHLKALLVLLALSPALLTACDLPGIASDSPNPFAAIGTPDRGDPAVVGVVAKTPAGSTVCSGALIAPQVVLTSARCVNNASAVKVGFGTTVIGDRPDATFFNATEWAVNPRYASISQNSISQNSISRSGISQNSVSQNPISQNADSAVLRLERAALALPLALNDNSRALVAGLRVRQVGFGYTDASGAELGTKYQAHGELDLVGQMGFGHVSAAGLSGDMGGPTFASIDGQEYVIGIHTTSSDGAATDARVDAQLDFIDTYLDLWR